jgi:tRNA(Arg) A34 adenosine deaminase TadA
LVVDSGLSMLHAEMVAFSLAQRKLGSYDLGGPGQPAHELVSSSEPCAMCLGGLFWSGVRHLVFGARDADVRALGFDEGPKPDDLERELAQRGIALTADVQRQAAIAVLQAYIDRAGPIYNARTEGLD